MSGYRVPYPPPPPPPMPGLDFNYALGGYNVSWPHWQIVRGHSLLSFLTWVLFAGNVSDAQHREIEHTEWVESETCHYYDRTEYHYHEPGEDCR